MRRIDDCERVHRELVDGVDGGRPRLAQGGVRAGDYYRFNVEVGVGEFGMNEWGRLAEVSTGTRRYLGQRETGRFVKECARKLVEVEQRRVEEGTQIRFRAEGAKKQEEAVRLNAQNIVAEMGQPSPPAPVQPEPHHPPWSNKMPIQPIARSCPRSHHADIADCIRRRSRSRSRRHSARSLVSSI